VQTVRRIYLDNLSTLTAAGRACLRRETEQWKRYADAVGWVLFQQWSRLDDGIPFPPGKVVPFLIEEAHLLTHFVDVLLERVENDQMFVRIHCRILYRL
jgi:hypothetical protein